MQNAGDSGSGMSHYMAEREGNFLERELPNVRKNDRCALGRSSARV